MAGQEALDTEAVETRSQGLSACVIFNGANPSFRAAEGGRTQNFPLEARWGVVSQPFAVVPQTTWQVMGLSEDCVISRHSESKLMVCEPRRWVGFV